MSAETKTKTLRMRFLSLKRIHDKFHPNEATAKSEGDTSMTYAELLQMVDLLATNLAQSIEGLLEARAECDEAIRERDEARRMACLGFSKPGWLSKQTAHSMGWDYLFEAGAK